MSDSTSSYSAACRKDIPYPSVSSESVPSLISNLVSALYGTITKSVVNRNVVWNIPCDPVNAPATVFGVPRNSGEGLLCYFIRALNQANSGTSTFYGSFVGNVTGNSTASGKLLGGDAQQLVYQTSTNNTGFLALGNSGQILTSNGTNLTWDNLQNIPSVSDARDKTEINPVPHGLDFVSRLNPVSYQFTRNRETNEPSGITKYGFLAQEILEIEGDHPVIVNANDPENLKMTDTAIIPILVKAVQELKQEIDFLKSKQ